MNSLRISTATITSANQFSQAVQFDSNSYFLVSVEGTFTAAVTLQKSYDNGVTWNDQPDSNWTTPIEMVCLAVDNSVLWRIGVKSGNYTSGSINTRISQ